MVKKVVGKVYNSIFQLFSFIKFKKIKMLRKKFVCNIDRNLIDKAQTNNVLIYDTSLASKNAGDSIIMDYCNSIINSIDFFKERKLYRIATHIKSDSFDRQKFDCQILCGTNILYTDMMSQKQWMYPLNFDLLDKLCLLGVGWNDYDSRKVPEETKIWYYKLLSNGYLHSVRDSYTEKKLKDIGIKNVINTSCPTMWRLTKKFCDKIPQQKADNVITTLTNYRMDEELDRFMLKTLKENYSKVYVWIQNSHDEIYLKKLVNIEDYIIVPYGLSNFDEILQKEKSLDYVGTRLHAGIRALNMKKRTLIIAVDNRAKEMAKDTNLPVIARENLKETLRGKINSQYKTVINLPMDNILTWRNQFKELD